MFPKSRYADKSPSLPGLSRKFASDDAATGRSLVAGSPLIVSYSLSALGELWAVLLKCLGHGHI